MAYTYTYKRASEPISIEVTDFKFKPGLNKVDWTFVGTLKILAHMEPKELVEPYRHFVRLVASYAGDFVAFVKDQDPDRYADLGGSSDSYSHPSTMEAVNGALIFTEAPFTVLNEDVAPEHIEGAKRAWNADSHYPNIR